MRDENDHRQQDAADRQDRIKLAVADFLQNVLPKLREKQSQRHRPGEAPSSLYRSGKHLRDDGQPTETQTPATPEVTSTGHADSGKAGNVVVGAISSTLVTRSAFYLGDR